jgi:hypothetical protein
MEAQRHGGLEVGFFDFLLCALPGGSDIEWF